LCVYIEGVVNNRGEPPLSLNLSDREAVQQWMNTHVTTVYHWMSTCKAGINNNTTVANEKFAVRKQLG